MGITTGLTINDYTQVQSYSSISAFPTTGSLNTLYIALDTNILYDWTGSAYASISVTTNANLTGAITSIGNATSLGSFSSANLSSALTDETGSGAAVFANSPTLITPALGTPSSGNLSNCTGIPAPVGSVIQVKSTTKTDTFSTTGTSFVDVTGLSVSITPSSASNTVLVTGSVFVSTPSTDVGFIKLLRGSTEICVGAAAGSRLSVTGGFYTAFGSTEVIVIPFSFLDSPATTSATTYKIQLASNSAGTVYINRSSADANSAATGRGASTITTQEIKG